MNTESIPELACIRIESKQFATEHTLHVRLCKGETYYLGALRLELDSVESIREMLASLDEATRAELSQDWLDMISIAKEPVAWIHGFSVYDRLTGDRVGSGGFKGAEDGRGFQLMNNLMDFVKVRSFPGGGTRVSMLRRLDIVE